MKDCWAYAPRQRPTFAKLVQRWADLKTPEGLRLLSQAIGAHAETLREFQDPCDNMNYLSQMNYTDVNVLPVPPKRTCE
jgi:hypothetical protein